MANASMADGGATPGRLHRTRPPAARTRSCRGEAGRAGGGAGAGSSSERSQRMEDQPPSGSPARRRPRRRQGAPTVMPGGLGTLETPGDEDVERIGTHGLAAALRLHAQHGVAPEPEAKY
ncbi:hypothetical protein PVAP13_5KG743550 [Panicum virgatum]|uniref:Uncharacterized protein n=1 Tax=Panicum virgatum TaxID=38727 RepID=A0A8T0T1D5_PANVG|nr:hypothetical protein PVAP13_5KG743550 [Panicum virgatum]